MNNFNLLSVLLIITLSISKVSAQESKCKSQLIYGNSSSNFLEFKSGSDKRTFFFESVDVFRNDQGGFTIYLPPFGFNNYTDELTTQEKKSPYNNKINSLTKVYFAWYPEENFKSDKYDFLEGDLLSNDCFFSDNRRELRRLFRTSSSNITVDTTTLGDKKKIVISSQSKENEGVSLKIQVETENLRKPLKFDLNGLKKMCEEYGINDCSYRRIYYHDQEQFLIIDKPGRDISFTTQLNGQSRIGIPKPGKFEAYKLKRLPNEVVLIQKYAITTEKEIDNPVFTLPLNNKPRALEAYDLQSAKLLKSYMSSNFIKLSASPLIIDKDQKSISENNATLKDYRPFYKTVVHEDLPEKQNVELSIKKPHDFYFTDDAGKLYKTTTEKNKQNIKYSCREVFLMPRSVTIDYKSDFGSEAAYLAYAEVLIGGDDFIKQGIQSKENSKERIRFNRKIEDAELDHLLSDNKKTSIKNFHEFFKSVPQVEIDYITYDYLAHDKNVFMLFNSFVNAKKIQDENPSSSESAFINVLKPVLDHYQIDTSKLRREQLLEAVKDSLTSSYDRDFIRIVEKGLTKSKLLFTIEQDSENGSISLLLNSFDEEGKLLLKAQYEENQINLGTKGFHKNYQIEMASVKNIWYAGQIYYNLPFLPLHENFKTEIYFTNFNKFTKYKKDTEGNTQIVPQVTATFNKIDFEVKGTEKITYNENEEEVFVVKISSTSKLEGLPGINNQTWSRKDDLMVNKEGKTYAKIYMSTSHPHQIFYIQLKSKRIHFLNGNQADNIKDWYLKTQSQ